MPPSTSAELVHRWSDLPQDSPMAGLTRRRVVGHHMMISEIVLKPGCVVPTHAHENEQYAVVVRGRIRFGLGAEGSPEREEVVVHGGGILHLPPNVPHSVEAVEEDSLVLDVFSPTSEKTGIDRA